MSISTVVTTGSALAALLPTVAVLTEGFGLLIGTLKSRTSVTLQDRPEAQVTKQQEAYVTAYLCCPASLPTTLVAGEPDVEFLQAVQGQLQFDQILGWFAYRPVSSLQPTNQECLISSSMAAALDSLHVKSHSPHTLFAIVSFLPRHEGSSCDVQQRMFQLSSISHELEAVDVQVRNVGEGGPLAQRYQPISPTPMLSYVPAFTLQKASAATKTETNLPSSSDGISASMLKSVAFSGLQTQVDAVESMYRKTVRQLESLAHKACVDAASS